jgi:hypothetical protein
MSCFRREDDNCALLDYYSASRGTITTIRCDSLCSIPEQRSSHIHREDTTVYPHVTLSKMQYNCDIHVKMFERSLKQKKTTLISKIL